MIHTSRQLKDFVRKLSKGDSLQAQIIIRNYIMERFLERLSLSQYKNNFVLKGGMLVAAMVGLDNRTTLDIDTTILPQSFRATYEKRGSTGVILDAEEGLQKIRYSIEMRELWRKYQNKFTFASNVSWDNAMDSVIQLYNKSKGIGV